MDQKQFETEYLNVPIVLHDTAACAALKEYDSLAEIFDANNFEQLKTAHGNINGRRLNSFIVGSFPNMQRIAEKYNTTIPEMKKHWNCIQDD